jgi:uncharacterized protein (DUF4415 family)
MREAPDPDDDDNPERTEADFAGAPSTELARKLRAQRGRPRLERPEVHVDFRLATDVVAGIKATGRGYTARVERVPREASAQGKL